MQLAAAALMLLTAAVMAHEPDLQTFPDYIEACSQRSGHPTGYSMGQLAADEESVSEDDACVFLCALRDAEWVNEQGQLSEDTVRALAKSNPEIVPKLKGQEHHLHELNERNDITSCQRAYQFARLGYKLYYYARTYGGDN